MARAYLAGPLLRPLLVLAAVAVIGAVVFASQRMGGETTSEDAALHLGLLDGDSALIGLPAPDFALETLDGDVVRLSDFRGQTVVINFWATWCLPCYLEMPELQYLYDERAPLGDLVVLGVNMTPQDSRAGAERFAEDQGLTFPVLLETDDFEVATGYGLERLPGTFFIDRDGVLREVSYGLMVGDALYDRVALTEAAADVAP